ncbi:MAG: hypothetical protein WCJ14_04800 [Verrucomicrobiota bacterium]
MKLEQGQIWQLGDEYLRIVTWERLSIEYKTLLDPQAKDGALQRVSKKEFCRLIKGAVLRKPDAPDTAPTSAGRWPPPNRSPRQ